MLRNAAYAFLLLSSLLAGPSCSKAPRPERAVKRQPLDLEFPRLRTNRPSKGVEPEFLPFAELSKGIEPPVRLKIASARKVEELPSEPLFYPEEEVNNSPETANVLSLPADVAGHIHPLLDSADGDHDWYTFLVERDRPAMLSVELSGVKKVDLAFELHYDSARGRTRLAVVDNESRGKSEKLPNVNLHNGRYYLHVYQTIGKKQKEPAWNILQPYRLTLRLKEVSPTQETEPNDGALTAIPLAMEAHMTGLANRRGDQDWYVLDLMQTSPYSHLALELLPPLDTTLDVSVLTHAREEMLTAQAKEGRKLFLPNIAVLKDSGVYYVRVSYQGQQIPQNPYTLSVTNKEMGERLELEPNDLPDISARQQLSWEEPVSGWIAHRDDVDWFYLEPDPHLVEALGDDEDSQDGPPALNIVLSGVPGINLVLELYEADRETLLGRFDTGGKGDGEEAPNLAVPAHTLFIKVLSRKGDNAQARYVLQARAVPTDGKEVEPNNQPSTANLIKSGRERVLGYLAPMGDRDCLAFQPGIGRVVVTPPDVRIRVSAYGPDGMLTAQGSSSGNESMRFPFGEGGGALCLEAHPEEEGAAASPYVLNLRTEDGPP